MENFIFCTVISSFAFPAPKFGGNDCSDAMLLPHDVNGGNNLSLLQSILKIFLLVFFVLQLFQ